jgi:hypothetical protein
MSDIEKKLMDSKESIIVPDIDGHEMLNRIKEKEVMTNKPKIWKRKPFIVSTIVSAVAIILVIGIFIGTNISKYSTNETLLDGKYKIVNKTNNEDATNSVENTFIVKRWDEKSIKEKYPSVKYNDKYYTLRTIFYDSTDLKYVGEKLGTGEAKGYDLYEDIYHYQNVEVYNILKVNNDVSIAIKFSDDDNYYSYSCCHYDFGNIGNFIDAINLYEYATFGSVSYRYTASDGKHYTIYFDNVDRNIIIDTFFKNRSISMINDDSSLGACPSYSFGISVEALGRNNLSMIVYPDGEVLTNLFGYARVFDIGEKGQQFLDYLNKDCEGYVIL